MVVRIERYLACRSRVKTRCKMADNINTPDERPPAVMAARSEAGCDASRTSLLQQSDAVKDAATSVAGSDGSQLGPGQVRGRCNSNSVLLFTINAGSMLFLWMIGVVYTTAVVRTAHICALLQDDILPTALYRGRYCLSLIHI